MSDVSYLCVFAIVTILIYLFDNIYVWLDEQPWLPFSLLHHPLARLGKLLKLTPVEGEHGEVVVYATN